MNRLDSNQTVAAGRATHNRIHREGQRNRTISRNTSGALAGVLLLAATATPAPAWETPFWLSEAGVETTGAPRLEVDGKGNAWFLWAQNDGGNWRVNVARKSPVLAVEAPDDVSAHTAL